MYLDLNADIGESFGRWSLGADESLLTIVTSANVACGFHAGDPTTLRAACVHAAAQGVAIGAQVGYRDIPGFGRRFIDYAPEDLTAEVLYQIGALDGLARAAGSRVSYVKPHGALYNAIVHHEAQARAVVDAVLAHRDPVTGEHLPLMGLPGSAVLRIAQAEGLRTVRESFADRAYTPEGTLVPRRQAGAVLHDADEIAARVVELARTGTIRAIDGTVVDVDADSVCVHGDSPGAVDIARHVRTALTDAGVTVRPFVESPPGEAGPTA